MRILPADSLIRAFNKNLQPYVRAMFPFKSSLQKQKLWLVKQELILRHHALGLLTEEEMKKIDTKQLAATIRSIREILSITEERKRPGAPSKEGDGVEETFDSDHRATLEDAMKKIEERGHGDTFPGANGTAADHGAARQGDEGGRAGAET